MLRIKNIFRSLLIALWIIILTFPIAVIKVNTVEKTIIWRWYNLLIIGIIAFITAFFWDYFLNRNKEEKENKNKIIFNISDFKDRHLNRPQIKIPVYFLFALIIIIFPFATGLYQINVITTALIYVMLGLGLNIVVGLGGLLNLGYVAFYAVGAYTYALLNKHFGIYFWIALPIGGIFSMIFGLLIGFPVLRLRGDYLAIVTLAFGEIVRIVLENWNDFSYGPSGISGIPKPGLFGLKLSLMQNSIFIYFIMVALTVITIIVVNRLENSRLGRTWVAMREDETACQTMGINITKAKLAAFALGALWAGLAGVVFAAKTTFINPASFTIWESIIILCIVVLGGMGSIPGVIIAAVILVVLPESLRFFSEYRMLVFGAILVIMMIFRPGGIINAKRKVYQYKGKQI